MIYQRVLLLHVHESKFERTLSAVENLDETAFAHYELFRTEYVAKRGKTVGRSLQAVIVNSLQEAPRVFGSEHPSARSVVRRSLHIWRLTRQPSDASTDRKVFRHGLWILWWARWFLLRWLLQTSFYPFQDLVTSQLQIAGVLSILRLHWKPGLKEPQWVGKVFRTTEWLAGSVAFVVHSPHRLIWVWPLANIIILFIH